MNYFGMIANIVDACFIILGKTGKILNARGNRICFLLDMTCLTYWFYMDIERGLYSQAIGVFVSLGIAIYGFRNWGKMNKDKKNG